MESSPASLRCFLKVPLKFQQYWRWIKQKQTDKRPWLPFLGSWEIISVLLQISRCKSSHIWGRYYFSGKQEDRLPVFKKMNKRKKRQENWHISSMKILSPVLSSFPPPPERRGERGYTGKGKSERRRLHFRRISTENKHDNCTEFSNLKHTDKKMARTW